MLILFVLPPQNNEWQDDWVTFYSLQRLQHQLNMAEKSYGDRESRELWAKLQVHSPFNTTTNIIISNLTVQLIYCLCYL